MDVVYMATDTVAVPDVLGEIASQLGMRVTEGPAELDI